LWQIYGKARYLFDLIFSEYLQITLKNHLRTACRHVQFCVSIGYTSAMPKDSGLRVRVQRDLRDRFLEACHAEDKPGAQVIREFMRDYVDQFERTRAPASNRRKR
jgi:hypothetical protein